jgi:lipopolysaccharide/colanic/teichoic acid biosynthesis glycosyltransferase
MDTAPLDALSPISRPPGHRSHIEGDWAVLRPGGRELASGAGDGEGEGEGDGNGDGSGPLGRTAGRAAKRAVDLTGAALGLVLLAPVLVLIALLIRLDSPGPALFRQRRLGRRGRPFWIHKFRTMRADAEGQLGALESRNEAAQGVLFKMQDDPRVTRLGRFLRRTNLDELPQLFNVLTGEMSLVGPRPFQLRDCARLWELDPVAFARRLEFTPGLTGAWQVSRRDPTDSEHLLDYDLEYVANWSLALDLQLLYRTFFLMLAGFRGR